MVGALNASVSLGEGVLQETVGDFLQALKKVLADDVFLVAFETQVRKQVLRLAIRNNCPV